MLTDGQQCFSMLPRSREVANRFYARDAEQSVHLCSDVSVYKDLMRLSQLWDTFTEQGFELLLAAAYMYIRIS